MPDRDFQNNVTTRAITDAGVSMPHDRAAEASVLSAMIIKQEALVDCLAVLNEQDFFIPSNRMIFEAIRTLFNRGHAVDPVSLADYLNSQNQLERVGGRSYLTELGGDTFALYNWEDHKDILIRDTTLRKLIEASAAITSLALDAPEDTREVVNIAESRLFEVTQREVENKYSRLQDVFSEMYVELDEMSRNSESVGVQTGVPGLDRALMGLRPGQMVVIGARPGVGKTSFALNLAVNAAARGTSVALFSLEMSSVEVAQRMVAAQAKGMTLSNIRGGRINDNQWPELIQATEELSQLDIMIDDNPETTVTEIRAKARRMLHDKSKKGLIIVDYLQLLSPPSGRRSDSRTTEVSEMSRGLKIMAKDLGVPVIALSQLSRGVENRSGKRPQLSDLRESGSIEQDADIVILIDRSLTEEEAKREDRPELNVTDFIIAKNRSGPLGTVSIAFFQDSTKFVEVDSYHQE
ncbi:MAG: replicative DNA helicase [Atopobiaceae bacterium]|nr:replicative DNA helicase [Atopobiaceae bacterium]